MKKPPIKRHFFVSYVTRSDFTECHFGNVSFTAERMPNMLELKQSIHNNLVSDGITPTGDIIVLNIQEFRHSDYQNLIFN